jgi:hypothetical protein
MYLFVYSAKHVLFHDTKLMASAGAKPLKVSVVPETARPNSGTTETARPYSGTTEIVSVTPETYDKTLKEHSTRTLQGHPPFFLRGCSEDLHSPFSFGERETSHFDRITSTSTMPFAHHIASSYYINN